MDLRKAIYVKDGKGYTALQDVSSIDNVAVRHLPEMKHLPHKLQQLKDSQPRIDDIWVLSYPKSGTHWVYEIIGILLSGKLQPLNHTKIDTFFDLMPFENLESLASPRVLNTHMRSKYFPKGTLDKGKIVLILRNPKSTAVSFYHHVYGMKFYQYDGPFEGFYDLYMQGIEDFYGSWFEHTTEWWDALKGRDNVLIVYYEDIKKNPIENIQKLSTFLGLNRNLEFCTETANLVSVETMKTHIGKSKESLALNNSLWKSGEHKFVRKGVIDDWKNYFTVKMDEDFQKVYDEKMTDHPAITAKMQYE